MLIAKSRFNEDILTLKSSTGLVTTPIIISICRTSRWWGRIFKRSINATEAYELPAPVSSSARHFTPCTSTTTTGYITVEFPREVVVINWSPSLSQIEVWCPFWKIWHKEDFCNLRPRVCLRCNWNRGVCYLATVCVRLTWSLSCSQLICDRVFLNKHTHNLARLSVVSGKICHVTASHLTSFGSHSFPSISWARRLTGESFILAKSHPSEQDLLLSLEVVDGHPDVSIYLLKFSHCFQWLHVKWKLLIKVVYFIRLRTIHCKQRHDILYVRVNHFARLAILPFKDVFCPFIAFRWERQAIDFFSYLGISQLFQISASN